MTLVKPVLLLELYLSQGECRALTIDLCISGIDLCISGIDLCISGIDRAR